LVEKELGCVAADARLLLSRLKALSPDSMELIHGWLGEHEPWWVPNARGLLDLRELAEDMEKLTNWAKASKQTPKGRREGVGRLPPVERLVFGIGQIVKFTQGKVTHILPIARVVHIWASGEVLGPAWGERPYKNVRASLESLDWSNVGNKECTPPDESQDNLWDHQIASVK
jgi:hypothetical protein